MSYDELINFNNGKEKLDQFLSQQIPTESSRPSVARILDRKEFERETKYLVLWEDISYKLATWENENRLLTETVNFEVKLGEYKVHLRNMKNRGKGHFGGD